MWRDNYILGNSVYTLPADSPAPDVIMTSATMMLCEMGMFVSFWEDILTIYDKIYEYPIFKGVILMWFKDRAPG